MVSIPPAESKGLGLEAAARNYRYAALARHIGKHDVLLTAHHADDQLETILLRLERGTELAGLAGMNGVVNEQVNKWGVYHLRPMLACSKADAQSYLEGNGWSWVEDPSNRSASFRRSYYRAEVVPQLSNSICQRLLDVASHASKCVEQLDLRCQQTRENTYLFPVGGNEKPTLSTFYLKRWLHAQGIGLPKSRLNELIRQLNTGAARGAGPFYACSDYQLWIKGRALTVRWIG